MEQTEESGVLPYLEEKANYHNVPVFPCLKTQKSERHFQGMLEVNLILYQVTSASITGCPC